MFGEHSRCNLSPFLSLLLSFLGVSLGSLLWWLMTVQNSQKSYLAKKPACILVGNVSLGLRLPPSSPYGSGCLSPEGDGLHPSYFCSVLCSVHGPGGVLCSSFSCGVLAIPQSGLLAQVSLLWLCTGCSGLNLTKHCSQRLPRLPAQPQLASG